jgi:hypothetical protein
MRTAGRNSPMHATCTGLTGVFSVHARLDEAVRTAGGSRLA